MVVDGENVVAGAGDIVVWHRQRRIALPPSATNLCTWSAFTLLIAL